MSLVSDLNVHGFENYLLPWAYFSYSVHSFWHWILSCTHLVHLQWSVLIDGRKAYNAECQMMFASTYRYDQHRHSKHQNRTVRYEFPDQKKTKLHTEARSAISKASVERRVEYHKRDRGHRIVQIVIMMRVLAYFTWNGKLRHDSRISQRAY